MQKYPDGGDLDGQACTVVCSTICEASALIRNRWIIVALAVVQDEGLDLELIAQPVELVRNDPWEEPARVRSWRVRGLSVSPAGRSEPTPERLVQRLFEGPAPTAREFLGTIVLERDGRPHGGSMMPPPGAVKSSPSAGGSRAESFPRDGPQRRGSDVIFVRQPAKQ
jgi:hypothetical protein